MTGEFDCIRYMYVTMDLSVVLREDNELTLALRINLATPNILPFFFFVLVSPWTCEYPLTLPLPRGVPPLEEDFFMPNRLRVLRGVSVLPAADDAATLTPPAVDEAATLCAAVLSSSVLDEDEGTGGDDPTVDLAVVVVLGLLAIGDGGKIFNPEVEAVEAASPGI